MINDNYIIDALYKYKYYNIYIYILYLDIYS